MDLCAIVGPALEVQRADFAALFRAVRSYEKYAEDWASAELYLACRGLARSACLLDISPPTCGNAAVREILVKFHAAMASRDRLNIVMLLRGANSLLSVSDVAAMLGRSHQMQSVRRHLRVLREARLVERHWDAGTGRYQHDRRAILANLELAEEVLL